MTLDVTIGKIIVGHLDYKDRAFLTVEECPEADFDVCDTKYSITPRISFRSGSSSFWRFFQDKNEQLTLLYHDLRDNPNSNDLDVTFLKPFLDRFNVLNIDSFEDAVDKDRLKWLKYWIVVAVELYDDLAGIKFS